MSRMIAWFVHNSVASNLLMAVLVVGGLLTLMALRQEEFPSIDTEIIQVSVAYLGATPEETEESVCVRLEEAIEGTPGVDQYTSVAAEGACAVSIWLQSSTDPNWALAEVKNRVDGISTFPTETEKPVVSYLIITDNVLEIAISGDADERTLKVLGQRLRDQIAALPEVSQATLDYVRPYEISIEVSEQALRRHDLTFDQVAEAVRLESLDLPGGSVRTASGEILLRSQGQAYRGAEFESIAVLTRPDGTTVRLGEIASVVDGFREDDLRAYFDGSPAVIVRVQQIGDESIRDIARAVKAHVAKARLEMPEGIELTIWQDESEGLRTRINTLLGNAGGGLLLVLIVLALILRFRLAMWVAAGIPIALLGAVMFFPIFDFAISTLAVMGFILVLGIVVDDAIVVGERVYAHEEQGKEPEQAAVDGTLEVSIPVIFGVLTTIAAFAPLVMVPGPMGQFFAVLGGTVIICLLLSLVEAQLILPGHLAHRRRSKRDAPRRGRWSGMQDKISGALEKVIQERYRPALERVLEWRYLALAIAVGVLILAGGLIQGGFVRFQFFPGIEGSRIFATLTMPRGTPLAQTEAAVRQLEGAVEDLRAELAATEPGIVRHVLSSIGKQVGRSGPGNPFASGGGTDLAQVVLEVAPSTERDITVKEISSRWRELTGTIPDAVELRYEAFKAHAGEAIAIRFSSDDMDELAAAAADLRVALASYDGVYDISDSFRTGKQEVRLRLRPEAKPLGVSVSDLARQVRTAFYGVEVQRVQRGQDDVRVMLRYPADERRSLGDLENMRIRTPAGVELPLAAVAHAELGRGFASIRRTDGRRVVTVTADVDRNRVTPEEVMASLRVGALRDILAAYPGLAFDLDGEQKERRRAMSGLGRGFLFALLVIFTLLAIPLRSYVQPLIIMSAIPFGAVGAILGHFIMGWDLVFFSLLGIVALAGVVVNDSLVLVDFINRRRRDGMQLADAVRSAGMARFRAIFLTSVTTFVGLIPLMFNSSEETFFVVPIAISLAFGVLVATAVTLFIVPCGYMITDDLVRLARREPREPEVYAGT